jgi:hypothetical protein
MPKARNALLSVGAALATTQLAHLVSSLELDALLRPLGLSRRHRHWRGNLGFLAAGVLVGAAGALLLAPATGGEARARVGKKAGELGQAALKKAREVGAELREEMNASTPA